jgi:hypothetical protein
MWNDESRAHGNIPLEYLKHHHVFHAELTEVGHDLWTDPLGQRRRLGGSGEVDPHEAAPLVDRHLRRAYVAKMILGEVFAFRHPDQLAGGVVHPSVVGAAEAPGAAPLPVADQSDTTVLTDVVERGERTVGLTGDDDRLTMALETRPIAGRSDVGGTRSEQPTASEHPLAFEFELHGIRVWLA